MRRRVLIAVVLVAIAAGACAKRPVRPDLPDEHALPPDPGTEFAGIEQRVEERLGPGRSGIATIDGPAEALRWRLAVLDHADRSIDIQTFLWSADASGFLLLQRLLDTADRGVKVRVLLDDLHVRDADRDIAALCRHPNLDIRVFNPWGERSGASRGLEWLFHMRQLNRRMHNKLFIGDNAVAIVGGRNVGDHYFGLGEDFNVVDFDVVMAGPTVRDVSDAFDFYWNGELAIPGPVLYTDSTDEDLEEIRRYTDEQVAAYTSNLASFPLERTDWTGRLRSVSDRMSSGDVTVTYDVPGDREEAPPIQVADALVAAGDTAQEDILIATAFFVPDDEDVAWYRETIERGVRVRVLTNSLASNMGTISNSGYKKYRKPLLDVGVELFELRMDAAIKPQFETPPMSGGFLGLHAKTVVIDRATTYVGSLNLDPRSLFLNTEMGMLVEDPALAEHTASFLERLMEPENAWRVYYDDAGKLTWANRDETVHKQPARGGGQRAKDWVFGILPIKKQL